MGSTVSKDRLVNCFEELEQLNNQEAGSTQTFEAQLARIEEEQDRGSLSPEESELLRGEHAFYRGQYKIALKHYLGAKEIPICQFCCLRTSAFVLEQQGKREKAISYAKRALALRSDDALTLHLLGKLLPAISPDMAPQALEQTISQLAEKLEPSPPESTQEEAVPLAEEEVTAIKEMFLEESSPETPADTQQTQEDMALSTPSLESMIERKMESAMDRDAATASKPAEKEDAATTEVTDKKEALDHLNRLADSRYEVKADATDQYLNKMGVGLDSEDELQEQIEAFQERRRDLIAAYTKAAKGTRTSDHALYVLSGWDSREEKVDSVGEELLAESSRKAAGGFFMRWNGKGVVVNPGPDFLKNFHHAGLHISDIDFVVVTRAASDAYADTTAIYRLNYELNLTAPSEELHIIHYYLNQQAHRELSAKLKPNFKQERNTLHSLELYVDSPDVEKVELCSEVCLNYFPVAHPDSQTSSKKGAQDPSLACLGIRLDCRSNEPTGCSISVGHVSGTAWSPLLANNMGRCDVLVAGLQRTSSKDFRKVKYNEESLGYFGCYSLMEEVTPRIMLCCEFDGKDGDIRLELTKKMRQEYAYSNQHGTCILPGDCGLYLDLKTLQVRCSVSHRLTDPSQVRVVKGQQAFGPLRYLAPSCFV